MIYERNESNLLIFRCQSGSVVVDYLGLYNSLLGPKGGSDAKQI